MKTSSLSASFPASNRRTDNRLNMRQAIGYSQSAVSDLVSLVLERAQILGCCNSNVSQIASKFPACAPVRPLLKRIAAGTGPQCRDDCFFNAVHRMNKVNFTRREILEEVSPGITIHPSIER
jgi:hypothetical protein